MKRFILMFVSLSLIGAGCAIRSTTTPPEPAPVAPAPPVPASAAPSVPTANVPQTVTVTMVPEGFSPTTLTIKKGDTVRFINQDTRPRWPASGMHPTHLICQGFDALRGIASGEVYEFTFKEAKICPMHDHLMPGLRGLVTVE